ncbi:peptidoglycan binding [Homalodisca vitripennis]|nr:peptidoglycan binding [Homalodisca vitripennis]
MGDLAVRVTEDLHDTADEDSLADWGAVQQFPRTSYSGLSVNNSSDIHVGPKYVADKIVIVVPNSDTKDIQNIQRSWSVETASEVTEVTSASRSYMVHALGGAFSVLFVSIVLFIGAEYIFSANKVNTDSNETSTSQQQLTDSKSLSTTARSTVPITNKTGTNFTSESTEMVFSLFTTYSLGENKSIDSVGRTGMVFTVTDALEVVSPTTLCSVLTAEHYALVLRPMYIDVPRVSGGKFCLVHPEEWGSHQCGVCKPFNDLSKAYKVSIHFIDACDSFEKCSVLMKVYQDNFYPQNSIADDNFLYNFVIGGDSRVYQELGWDWLVYNSAKVHIGIQMDGRDNKLNERQLYILMILINVGNWCNKIAKSFDLELVCPITDCIRYYGVQRNIRFLSDNKYLIREDDKNIFNNDSINFGKMFTACDNYQFYPSYTLCKDLNCN